MKKQELKHKVTINQNGREVTFRLTDKEYKELQGYSHDGRMMYNFSAFAWANYELSSSKCGRFHKHFFYNKGDFFWWNEE